MARPTPMFKKQEELRSQTCVPERCLVNAAAAAAAKSLHSPSVLNPEFELKFSDSNTYALFIKMHNFSTTVSAEAGVKLILRKHSLMIRHLGNPSDMT